MSAALTALARPSSLLLLGLLAGSLGQLAGLGALAQAPLLLSVLGLLLATLLPLGLWLLRPLEDRFPMPRRYPERVDGVIVLGNGPDGVLTAARDEPALGEPAERFAAMIELGLRFPTARLVFSGGRPGGARDPMSEAQAARLYYERQGFDADRIVYEDEARNTHQNARNVRRLTGPVASGRWLLVTSARAMPRAVGTFWRQGLAVEAWPVDYLTPGPVGLALSFRLPRRLQQLDQAAHEWLGLLAYRLRGWTDRLYPGPGGPP